MTETWRSFARCRGMDPELFFPAKGEDSRQIIQLCKECPVVAPCLAYALENFERHGVWGGTSEAQRRRMRRHVRARQAS